jgi:hypothetical protein
MASKSNPTSSSSGTKVPIAADYNQVLSRVSLALSKQNDFLKTFRASRQAAIGSSGSAGAGYYSALSGSANRRGHAKTTAEVDAEEAELRAEAAMPPNAGIGLQVSKESLTAAQAKSDLSRKLLGKRSGDSDARGAAAKKQKAEESSDEEEGRSGLGRKKSSKNTLELRPADEAVVGVEHGIAHPHESGLGEVVMEPLEEEKVEHDSKDDTEPETEQDRLERKRQKNRERKKVKREKKKRQQQQIS